VRIFVEIAWKKGKEHPHKYSHPNNWLIGIFVLCGLHELDNVHRTMFIGLFYYLQKPIKLRGEPIDRLCWSPVRQNWGSEM